MKMSFLSRHSLRLASLGVFLTLAALTVQAQDAASAPAEPAPAVDPASADATPSTPMPSTDVLPGDGFKVAKYKVLWTKSPFSVASPETAADSADYSILGVAQIDGVSYACLMDKSNNETFVVTSQAPSHGLTLQSITRDKESVAVLMRNGEPLSLKMDASAAAQAAAPGPPPAPPQGIQPGMPPPVSPYPARSAYPNANRGYGTPGQPGQPGQRIRPRHRPIQIPARPTAPGQPVPNQAPATP